MILEEIEKKIDFHVAEKKRRLDEIEQQYGVGARIAAVLIVSEENEIDFYNSLKKLKIEHG